jgi:hypothetical protein
MKLSRASANEHGEIRVSMSSLSFELSNVANVLELGLGAGSILFIVSSESTQDPAGFVLAADFGEPARRLGEEPADSKEEKQGDDLKADRESPPEGRVVVVKGETAGKMLANLGLNIDCRVSSGRR